MPVRDTEKSAGRTIDLAHKEDLVFSDSSLSP